MANVQSPAYAGILKRSAVAAALIVGLAGGTVGGALLPSVSAQDSSSSAIAQTSGDASIADVVEMVNPAVVTIINLQETVNPFNGQSTTDEPEAMGSGSGFIIDEAGHIVTNYHVTNGGDAFQVRFYDGEVMTATYVGGDRLQDVAVLKLDLEEGTSVPAIVAFSEPGSLRAGETVIALGSPFGELTNSVTTGIVNATDRSLDTGLGYALPNLIQHDADIYPGNSGGPLVNVEGEVVGINVAKATFANGTSDGDSIGFAISGDAAAEIVEGILEDGTFDRAFLGVEAQPVAIQGNPNAMFGESIVTVVEDSPAAQAGIIEGDIVTAVDGVQIDEQNHFVNLVVLENDPGDTVVLTVERNGEELEIEVTLGVRPVEAIS